MKKIPYYNGEPGEIPPDTKNPHRSEFEKKIRRPKKPSKYQGASDLRLRTHLADLPGLLDFMNSRNPKF